MSMTKTGAALTILMIALLLVIPGLFYGNINSLNDKNTKETKMDSGTINTGLVQEPAHTDLWQALQPGGINYDEYGNNRPADYAAPDPYAQWGGQTAYNTLVSGFNTQKDNIFGTARDAASNFALGQRNNILDWLDSLKAQQMQVNNRGVQAELSKNQGTQGVLGMVGRGIRSAGTMLANRNASDSSATEAVSRAYGDLGRRELSGIGNQYGQAMNEVDQMQQQLGVARASGQRRFDTEKQQTVNSIVLDARNKFAQLDAAMASASLPERINIEAEKERVRQEALGQLQGLDQDLAQAQQINPTSQTDRQAEAARLAGLGTAPESAFSFTSQAPAQFQNTGPFPGSFPLFTLNRRREG